MKAPLALLPASLAALVLGAGLAAAQQQQPAAPDGATTAPVQPISRNLSNWPQVPQSQSGRPYRAVIQDGFGDRERNFESGRQ